MSDTSGNKTEGPYNYDPCGNCTVGGVPCAGGVAYKYTGQRYDSETGIYYYRARYYSPALGRFLQTDPIGYSEDVNLYAYVGNDPTDKVDPSGETCTTTKDGSQNCQIDQVVGNPTKAQQAKIQTFNRSYTAAVNNLASHPDRTASIKVPAMGPDGKPTGNFRSTTITAGSLAKALEGRPVIANVSQSGGNALATTLGPTTVYSNGLSGAGLGGLTKGNTELGRQITITHEGIHGTDEEARLSPSGLMNGPLNQAHQQPYNQAAEELLGIQP